MRSVKQGRLASTSTFCGGRNHRGQANTMHLFLYSRMKIAVV